MHLSFWKYFLLTVLLLPISINFLGNNNGKLVANAVEEDSLDGEDEDAEEASVESEENIAPNTESDSTETAATDQGEKEEEVDKLKPSPNAETSILFIKPITTDLPAGKLVKILVGFTNNGEQNFHVDSIDAAFRYPQDYSYYIQNFTVVKYNSIVEPKKQMTFAYSFLPSDAFSSRPFGLTVNLNYKDMDDKMYQDAVFNDTVSITELDEGLDGETFFLYVFLAAMVVLMVVGIQQLFVSYGKKRLNIKSIKPSFEVGTKNKSDVDFDWIPKQNLNDIKKSPGKSPKQSPRQRTTRGNAVKA